MFPHMQQITLCYSGVVMLQLNLTTNYYPKGSPD